MGYYILMFLIPIAVWLVIVKFYFHYTISIKEAMLQFGATVLVISLVFVGGRYSQLSDTMIINGSVTDTVAKRQNCPIGWQDWTDGFCTEYTTRQVKTGETCSTNSDGRRTCTPNYKTQYRYIYGWEQRYFVITDIPQTYEISRVDRQGVNTPPRFSSVNVGDPASSTRSYINYVKGASHTLFRSEQLEPTAIAYPRIQDYYNINRVLFVNRAADTAMWEEWNREIALVNSRLKKVGANVILVITDNPQTWAESLARDWYAHKINDVVVVIGMSGDSIAWVDARSWSTNELVDIEVRDSVLDIGSLDIKQISANIERVVSSNFVLADPSDFEYLADDIPPPLWAMILAFLVLFGATPAITYYMHKNELV